MKIYDKVKAFLVEYPRARERKFKNEAIVHILWQSHALDISGVSKTLLCVLFQDYASYDRAWRKVLEECPDLRGTDYGDKEILEQEKMLELDYEPGTRKLKI